MITISSSEQLVKAKKALDSSKSAHPLTFEKLIHIINLTRTLQFKYHYMGSLLMNEDSSQYYPSLVPASVLDLYQQEIQKFKDMPDSEEVLKLFAAYQSIGYAKLSLLVLGKSPESLLGALVIK